MKDKRIWNLIGRQLAGEATPEELDEIDVWLRSHPDHAWLYQSIGAYWQNNKKIPESDASRAWYALSRKIHQVAPAEEKVNSAKKYSFYRFYRIAAAVALCLLAAWLLFQYGAQRLLNLTATIEENARGIRSELMLPDGSQVWLNADSKLTYHQNFGETSRTVYLTGEAFFEVVKNPAIPFIIDLGAHQIQVLGTSFNVKSYADDKIVETSVVTGKVKFIKHGAHSEKDDSVYFITPNHKLAFFKDSGQVEKVAVDSREDRAWIEGKLVFKNEPWSQIAKTLERTYNVTIGFEDPSIKNCRLTATFQEENIEEVLQLIAMTGDFSYEIQRQVLIKGQGCISNQANH